MPPKSFRRTAGPPPHEVRSGGPAMSEDDLGAKPLTSPASIRDGDYRYSI